ncbi:potassium channel family protein [Humibacillus xanthopallidus]|uniref:Voltage-gated potassium channel n=1 Tax=Humibacillus xanthopallidus TaxID=412689 RepID=A0A543HGF9_9MICO|nr:potassium channel protein [Humibacillus xanthopallidus]TQM57410.1 voltage-gated potassium channel [Humibacillus xanthopallidus]
MLTSKSSRRRALLVGVDSGRSAVHRITLAVLALVAVTLFGVIGYLVLGFTPLEAMYQTITTVATVGFREVRPLTAAGQVFTMALILLGVGTVLYNLGVIVEALIEGHLREHVERRRMDRRIAALSGHVVICGYGRVGRAATAHLLATGNEVVVIDSDERRLGDLMTSHLLGDALDDDTLRAAGIDRARALIIALDTDTDTVYVTLSARALRPDLVIISRARTVDAKEKMVLAGATRAVNPQLIGGRRMASFALHGDVAEFLDVVMHDEDIEYRIDQIRIPEDSPASGRTLRELDLLGRSGAQVLGVRMRDRGQFVANPPPETVLTTGMTVIALGDPAQIGALMALVGL